MRNIIASTALIAGLSSATLSTSALAKTAISSDFSVEVVEDRIPMPLRRGDGFVRGVQCEAEFGGETYDCYYVSYENAAEDS